MEFNKENNGTQGIKLYLIFKTKNQSDSNFNYEEGNVMTVIDETTEDNFYYCRRAYTNKIVNYRKQILIEDQDEILFRARKAKKGYYELIWPIAKVDSLDMNNLKDLDNKMWYVVNSENNKNTMSIYENKNDGYYLSENDILKVGKKKYEIIKLNLTLKTNEETTNNKNSGSVLYLPLKNLLNNEDKNENEQNVFNPENECRICYTNMSNIVDPLLKMCKCNAYIHFSCLKLFLKSHIIVSTNSFETVYSYKCQNFNCEVCQEPYPLKFEVKLSEEEKRTYCLIDGLEQPENTDYMILESLTFVKKEEKKNSKNIFVIKLTDQEINIGRNDDNDIIDEETSISRHHAVLKYDKIEGKVKIINKGKYGTLVLIKNNVKLDLEKNRRIYFQVGKTYIHAEVKEDNK